MKANTMSKLAALSSSRFSTWLKTATMTPAFRSGRLPAALGIAGMILVVCMSGNAFAARKTCDDGSYPPCKDTGEAVGNNLSLPGVLTPSSGDETAANWHPPENPVLGVHYSYGCDQEEKWEEFTYPNTSCVDDLAAPTVYLDAAACTASGAPCEDFAESEVSRIFWQKVEVNDWSADMTTTNDPLEVAYVDWGDALEAVSWTERSVIRVETQPYSSTIPGFNPYVATCEDATSDPANDCKVGFQMWHVQGQGTTEHWGVRADESNVSYNYDSPFQIINTPYARLNLAKMESGAAECASPGGGEEDEALILADPPPDVGIWTGSAWQDACTWYDAPYSVELSVGGKYVYGYNWRMINVALEPCGPGWLKTGWWRLTFYSPPISAVNFSDGNAPNIAPPASPAEVRDLPRDSFNLTWASGDWPPADDRLYAPVIDVGNNLTYIDICIKSKTQGGKKNP